MDGYKPDAMTRQPVADEIPLANVVRLECRTGLWYATLGPRGYSIGASASSPLIALTRLALLADRSGWAWDETWRDRLE